MSTGEELIGNAERCSDRGGHNRGLKFASEALELAYNPSFSPKNQNHHRMAACL